VVACGGGGIPMVRRANGLLEGVEAVIDKDRASALLASSLGVEAFIVSTDTQFVYLDYGKPNQRPVREIAASDLEKQLAAGQFPPGSMGPKIESALRFLRNGGGEVVITSYEYLLDAMHGRSGTHVVAGRRERATGIAETEAFASTLATAARRQDAGAPVTKAAATKAMAAAAGAGALGRAAATRIEPCAMKYRRHKVNG
jgi:hypothetical protein